MKHNIFLLFSITIICTNLNCYQEANSFKQVSDCQRLCRSLYLGAASFYNLNLDTCQPRLQCSQDIAYNDIQNTCVNLTDGTDIPKVIVSIELPEENDSSSIICEEGLYSDGSCNCLNNSNFNYTSEGIRLNCTSQMRRENKNELV